MKISRILLKLSGEALASGDEQYSHDRMTKIAQAIASLINDGVQVGIVVGAGNIYRGRSANLEVVDRVTADNVGMLATVMNAGILRDYLWAEGMNSRIYTPSEMRPLTRAFSRDAALKDLSSGYALIFAGGTGNPYFTTDSAAALRALEISAEVLVKGTQVDGVYDKDPHKYPDAKRYDQLTYDDVIDQRLGVMDLTAVTLCAEQSLPMFVFDISEPADLSKVIAGTQPGTWIKKES